MRPLADFFCGAGLQREGLDGWECVYANDNDPAKARMYQARFPDTQVHVCDVMNTDEVVARIPRGVVLAAGGFPCTDLSAGGKKQGLDGPRSSAWYGWVAVLEALGAGRPPLVLVENVCGLFTHHNGEGFREVALGLHRLGYRLACFVLHGSDFVPQSRTRIFFVGVADGIPVPEIEVSRDWERRVRPAKLALLMNDMDIPWLTVMPPPPLPRQDRLEDLVDLDGGGWWEEGRVRRYVAKMTTTTRKRLYQLLDGDGLRVAGMGWKSKGWGSKFNGLAPCFLTSRHGSSYQLLVVVENGRLRMRQFSVAECGLLMGSAGDWTRFNEMEARRGLGNGVIVPAVRWIDKHILSPIATTIRPTGGKDAPGIQLHLADCRDFDWPEVDLIFSDPPYSDLDAYGWLGRMGAEKLKPGRLALVYADPFKLPEQIRLLTASGLRYVATFAIAYPLAAAGKPLLGFVAGNLRPVVVLSQGKPQPPGRMVFAAQCQKRYAKKWHRWEQAIEPAIAWISRLAPPGGLVADPFLGGATTAAAVRRVGGLKFVGTEIDADAFRSACRRLAEEGVQAVA